MRRWDRGSELLLGDFYSHMLINGTPRHWWGLACDWTRQSVQLEWENSGMRSVIRAVFMVQQHVEDFWTGHLLLHSCLWPVDCGIFVNRIIKWFFGLLNFLPNCIWLLYTETHWVCYVMYLKCSLNPATWFECSHWHDVAMPETLLLTA